MKTVAIIGGGPAGMMAAYAASLNTEREVFLFEKNVMPGRKLLITGKGRCNITNMGDMVSYMENIPHNGAFMFSALSRFSNYDLIGLLNENGLKTKTERGRRAFPASDKASEVVEFFIALLKKQKINLNFGFITDKIMYNTDNKNFRLLFKNGEIFDADSVIICTGGLSYPKTGSNGDGYRFAKEMGHSVTKLYPSLVALKTKERFVANLSGLSLKNVGITIKDSAGKTAYEDFGEMLFTHFGVSGPIILSASARIAKRAESEEFSLYIDLKSALDEKALDLRLLKDFEKNKNKDILNSLDELLPKSMIPYVIEKAGVGRHKKIHDITKQERKALIKAVKAFALTIAGTDGYSHAVVTCGGIKTNEINPKTMESKIVSGLFFAGEVIDVDAYTGGFNLQIAFSTGYLAGSNS